MTERERERTYFALCVAAILVSPLLGYEIVSEGASITVHPGFFIGALFIGFFVPFLLEPIFQLAKGQGLGIWITNPQARSSHRLKCHPESAIDDILSRARRCAFDAQVFPRNSATQIVLGKGKQSANVHGFLDHAFFGEVWLHPGAFGIEVTGNLTFNDTLILETGEREKLQALCDYLSLASDTYKDESASLVLYQATSIAVVSTITAAVLALGPALAPGWVFSASLACAGMLVFVAVAMLRDRRHLFGWRLVWASFYLALVPWGAFLVSLL